MALAEAAFYCAAQLDDDLDRRRLAEKSSSQLDQTMDYRSCWELPDWLQDWMVGKFADEMACSPSVESLQCACNVLSQTEGSRDSLAQNDRMLAGLAMASAASPPVDGSLRPSVKPARPLVLALRARLALGSTLTDESIRRIAAPLVRCLEIPQQTGAPAGDGYEASALLLLADLAQPSEAMHRWQLVFSSPESNAAPSSGAGTDDLSRGREIEG